MTMKKITISIPDKLHHAADRARRIYTVKISMNQFIANAIAERCRACGFDPKTSEPIETLRARYNG